MLKNLVLRLDNSLLKKYPADLHHIGKRRVKLPTTVSNTAASNNTNALSLNSLKAIVEREYNFLNSDSYYMKCVYADGTTCGYLNNDADVEIAHHLSIRNNVNTCTNQGKLRRLLAETNGNNIANVVSTADGLKTNVDVGTKSKPVVSAAAVAPGTSLIVSLGAADSLVTIPSLPTTMAVASSAGNTTNNFLWENNISLSSSDPNSNSASSSGPSALERSLNAHVSYTMISFYKYIATPAVPTGISNPSSRSLVDLVTELHERWSTFGALGRVYVAAEGINAQVCIPTALVSAFETDTRTHVMELKEMQFTVGNTFDCFNFHTLDLWGDHAAGCGGSTEGDGGEVLRALGELLPPASDGTCSPLLMPRHRAPFAKLDIKIRKRIVADDLEGFLAHKHHHEQQQVGAAAVVPELDLQTNCGIELTAEQWHAHLLQLNTSDETVNDGEGSSNRSHRNNSNSSNNKPPLILDCRNNYESDLGHFKNAVPLDTVNFRDTWSRLDGILSSGGNSGGNSGSNKSDNKNNLTANGGGDRNGGDMYVGKDEPVYMYCTGGIRCVKVASYMQQVLGYKNVYRLKGGIVSYNQYIHSNCNNDNSNNIHIHSHRYTDPKESLFMGVNYVFDGRLSEPVTNEVISTCISCGTECNTPTNCMFCNTRMVQCAPCNARFGQCCSAACLENRQLGRVYSSNSAGISTISPRMPKVHKALKHSAASMGATGRTTDKRVDSYSESLNSYCEQYSTPESRLLANIRSETQALYPDKPNIVRMLCSPLQASLLSLLITLVKPKRVLELGTFTGYATMCMAETMAKNSVADDGKREVVTVDVDLTAHAGMSSPGNVTGSPLVIARRNFADFNSRHSGVSIYSMKTTAVEALREAKTKGLGRGLLTDSTDPSVGLFDFVYVDVDKRSYGDYLWELLGYHTQLQTPLGHQTQTQTQTVDGSAPARGLCLLAPGAVLMIDNTLWKGAVMDHSTDVAHAAAAGNAMEQKYHDNWTEDVHAMPMSMPSQATVKDIRRRKSKMLQTKQMHQFNESLVDINAALSKHFETVVQLPMRDGVTLLRYRG